MNASLTLFWSKPSVWVATTKSWVRIEVTFPGNIPASFFLTLDILSFTAVYCYWGWLYFKLWGTGDDFLLLMECSRSSVKCCYWMLAAWCLLWQEFICTVTNIFKQAGFLLSQPDVSFTNIIFTINYENKHQFSNSKVVIVTLWPLRAGSLPSTGWRQGPGAQRDVSFDHRRLCDSILESVEPTEPGKLRLSWKNNSLCILGKSNATSNYPPPTSIEIQVWFLSSSQWQPNTQKLLSLTVRVYV